MTAEISPRALSGCVRVPDSKSQLQRLVLCAMLADGETKIGFHGLSADVEAVLRCAAALGAGIEVSENTISVAPCVLIPTDERPVLDCGESAATARFLLPIAAALCGGFTLTGSGSLLRRSMAPICAALAPHGVSFGAETLPLAVTGRISGQDFSVDTGVSSQFLSGLLLASPLLHGCRIRTSGDAVSAPYTELTISEMARFGVRVERDGRNFAVPDSAGYVSPGAVTAEGDWSAAAYWLCAAELTGKPIEVCGLSDDSAQGDRRITEYIAYLRGSGSREVPLMQNPDLFPCLAVLAAGRDGETVFRGTARLRHKESDRVQAVSALLTALGGRCTGEADSFTVTGGGLRGGEADSFGDHRIAMAAALASCLCREKLILHGAEAVGKSYPAFWEDFRSLGGSVRQL